MEPKIDGPLYRAFDLDRKAIDKEARTVTLSFSSETKEVERWFGVEILDHSPGSVRLGRLKSGGPILDTHGGDQIAVVESAEIGPDKKGRARIRFGKSNRAEEIFQDVIDDIRRNVSVGYRVFKMVLEEEKKGELPVYRAVDWEPLEISFQPVPADVSVGVGRSKNFKTEGEKKMEKTSSGAGAEEKTRILEIQAVGEFHKCQAEAKRAIEGDWSIDDFKNWVLKHKYKAKPLDLDLNIGMSENDMRQFSFVRAISALQTKDWSKAGFERECSEAVAQKLRRSPQGMFIPFDVLSHGQRDLTKGTFSAGGALVETQLLSGSFIEMLRNASMVKRLGARVLTGLVGDVAIPRQSGGATAYWVGENVAPAESQQAFGQVGMTPKTVGAFTDISRKLLIQSSVDVEGLVRSDLAALLATEIDRVAVNGLGSAGEPLGILNTTGIGDVAGGTNGLAPTWAHMVDLEGEVFVDNAATGRLGYLTNAKVRAKLKKTEKSANTGIYIWPDMPEREAGISTLNSHPAATSNNVPSNLTKGTSSGVCSAILFGNWADLVIGEWGILDLLVDPYTGGTSGTVRVRVLQDVDVALRHAESFAAMKDALTT